MSGRRRRSSVPEPKDGDRYSPTDYLRDLHQRALLRQRVRRRKSRSQEHVSLAERISSTKREQKSPAISLAEKILNTKRAQEKPIVSLYQREETGEYMVCQYYFQPQFLAAALNSICKHIRNLLTALRK